MVGEGKGACWVGLPFVFHERDGPFGTHSTVACVCIKINQLNVMMSRFGSSETRGGTVPSRPPGRALFVL